MTEMLSVYTLILLISFCVGDEEILKLTAECPRTISGTPVLKLRTDVNGYAQAKCKNGLKAFTPDQDGVEHILVGSFDQGYTGPDCQIYKKSDINTYTVEVEYGMGEKEAEGIFHSNIETVSCAYDEFGNAVSNKEIVGDAILAAEEYQNLVGPEADDAAFNLVVMNVLDETIIDEKIDIGRKIRLYTTKSNTSLSGFRAVSCMAQNGNSRYPILVAGCGDGLIIPQSMGFFTRGNKVYSPYFKSFRLRGSGAVQFHCDFILCPGNCDGDSCTTENNRNKRSLPDSDIINNKTMVSVKSGPIWVNSKPNDRLKTDIWVNEWTEEAPMKQEEPRAQVKDSESFISLPTIAGIVLVFMCMIATILTVYFVLTTPRSRFVGICSNNA